MPIYNQNQKTFLISEEIKGAVACVYVSLHKGAGLYK